MAVTQHGLAACSQLLPTDLTSVPGTCTTTNSSASITALTVDPRDYFVAGDLIIFSDEADVVYGITSLTASTMTLTTAKAASGNGTLRTMVKASFNIPATTPAPATLTAGPGTASVTLNSNAVAVGSGTPAFSTRYDGEGTNAAVSGSGSALSVGDGVHFGTDTKVYVVRAVTGTTITLETPYTGATNATIAWRKANYSPRRHDNTATANSNGATNKYGRFGAVAIGVATTAAAATDTGLGSEIITSGGQRRSGSNVTTYLETADSGVSWKSVWQTTFTFSASFSVSELGVFDDAVVNRGYCMLRQVFVTPLEVVSTDVLNLKISVTHSATVSGGGSNPSGAVVSIGLKEAAKLILDPATVVTLAGTVTTTNGSPTVTTTSDLSNVLPAGTFVLFSGQATTPYTVSSITPTTITLTANYTGTGGSGQTATRAYDNVLTPGSVWAAVQGQQFDSIGLGSGATVVAMADVILGTEITGNGTDRKTGTAVVGQMMRNADSANVTPFTFSTDVSGGSAFAGDTVQWRATFAITGTVNVREQGVFNHSATGNNDPTAGSRMLIHQVFLANLALISSDEYTPVIRLQST